MTSYCPWDKCQIPQAHIRCSKICSGIILQHYPSILFTNSALCWQFPDRPLGFCTQLLCWEYHFFFHSQPSILWTTTQPLQLFLTSRPCCPINPGAPLPCLSSADTATYRQSLPQSAVVVCLLSSHHINGQGVVSCFITVFYHMPSTRYMLTTQ